ncbi:TPA: hypothetical protein DF272_05760 [Candidatus Falkowbacteria bacterium]|nr:hypothetical protein [Candidatus Falkowbacteria bacterium]
MLAAALDGRLSVGVREERPEVDRGRVELALLLVLLLLGVLAGAEAGGAADRLALGLLAELGRGEGVLEAARAVVGLVHLAHVGVESLELQVLAAAERDVAAGVVLDDHHLGGGDDVRRLDQVDVADVAVRRGLLVDTDRADRGAAGEQLAEEEVVDHQRLAGLFQQMAGQADPLEMRRDRGAVGQGGVGDDAHRLLIGHQLGDADLNGVLLVDEVVRDVLGVGVGALELAHRILRKMARLGVMWRQCAAGMECTVLSIISYF